VWEDLYPGADTKGPRKFVGCSGHEITAVPEHAKVHVTEVVNMVLADADRWVNNNFEAEVSALTLGLGRFTGRVLSWPNTCGASTILRAENLTAWW